MSPNFAYCLVDSRGRTVAWTVRSRKRDVTPAAEEWSGYDIATLKSPKFGYRVAKVQIVEVKS